MQLACAGDRYAFDRLLVSLAAPLRGFLGRRVHRHAVDDVMQETLLAAWTALPRFEPRPHATFDRWFYRIARNKAADWSRRNAYQFAREVPLTPADEDRLAAPDTLAAAAERKAEISVLLEALSPDQKTVIELYYTDGLTLSEIALKTNRKLSTVKYHFYRAQEALMAARRAAEEAK